MAAAQPAPIAHITIVANGLRFHALAAGPAEEPERVVALLLEFLRR